MEERISRRLKPVSSWPNQGRTLKEGTLKKLDLLFSVPHEDLEYVPSQASPEYVFHLQIRLNILPFSLDINCLSLSSFCMVDF